MELTLFKIGDKVQVKDSTLKALGGGENISAVITDIKYGCYETDVKCLCTQCKKHPPGMSLWTEDQLELREN